MRKQNWLGGFLALTLLLVPRFSLYAAEPTPTPTPAPTPDLNQVFPEKTGNALGDRGERTVRIQQRLRDLGYLSYRPTGYFMNMTQKAVTAFQNNPSLMADGAGVVGSETMEYLFSSLAKRKTVAPESGGVRPKDNPYPRAGSLTEWAVVNAVLPENAQFTVVDTATSIRFTAVRVGGQGHMDIVTADGESYQNYLKIFSGKVSSNKRPVVVEYDDQRYAASLYGMPHGENTGVGGGMQGYTCLYFQGSLSNGLGIVDAEHNANIQIAAKKEE